MAAIVRVVKSSALRRFIILHPNQHIRAISTSGKKRDTVTVTEQVDKCKTESASSKNWVSYGFDFKDETADKDVMHSTFFFSVTLCLVFGGFLWAYLPDYGMRDWAQREGFLELRRREEQGLPAISPNLISEEAIVLPSDEELGETEIII